MKKQKIAVALLSAMMLTTASTSALFPTLTTYAATTAEATNGVATMGSGAASIEIDGNQGQTLAGKKFNVYKLFNAENAKNGESINYTFNPAYAPALKSIVARKLSTQAEKVTEYMVIDYINSLNTNKVEGATTAQTLEGRYSDFRYFIEELRSEMVALGEKPDVVTIASTTTDNKFTLKGLDYGYYVIDEVTNVQDKNTAASLCMVNTANPTAVIQIKSDYPSVVKKIKEDDIGTNVNASITDKDGWNDIADYEIGQTVPYKFTSTVPNINGYDTYYFAWHDKMDEALTLNKNSVSIQISGNVNGVAKTYTLKANEFALTIPTDAKATDTFQVSITDIKAIVDREFNNKNALKENTYGQTVVLTYNATLNDKAATRTGRSGIENDVRLEFSNDADATGDGRTGYTPWDTVVCFTYKLDVTKTNNHDAVLEGAKFRLYYDKDCTKEVYVKAGNDGYIVINGDTAGTTTPANAVEMETPEDGNFVIFGLDQGTYYLKETAAPAGYRKILKPITLTVTPTYVTNRDNYIKGDGVTDKTLVKLDATAHIETFFDGITHTSDDKLTTDVAAGEADITVINQVGTKLPITGTPALVLMLGAGTAMMTFALKGKRKEEE